jgi:ribosomal-protein-alanine N-acetyltransferase
MVDERAPLAEGLALQPARTEDSHVLAVIDASSQRWSRDAFAKEVDHEPPTLFVLRADGAIVAFVVVRVAGPDLDIVNIAVQEGRRRQGLGRILLRMLFKELAPRGVKRAFLEVREGNQAARAFYLRLGFEQTQRRPRFYSNPVEDAILMSLRLEP